MCCTCSKKEGTDQLVDLGLKTSVCLLTGFLQQGSATHGATALPNGSVHTLESIGNILHTHHSGTLERPGFSSEPTVLPALCCLTGLKMTHLNTQCLLVKLIYWVILFLRHHCQVCRL